MDNKYISTNESTYLIVKIIPEKVYNPELERKREKNCQKMERLRNERIEEMTKFDSIMDSLFKKFDKEYKHVQKIMKKALK